MTKHLRELTPEDVIVAEKALMNFQFAVIDAMREKKISQTELADMLGISKARISQMLSSEANPTLKVVGRTLHALDIDAIYVDKTKPKEAAIAEFKCEWEAIPSFWDVKPAPTKMMWHNDNKVIKYRISDGHREAA